MTPLELVALAERMKRSTRHPDALTMCEAVLSTDMGAPAKCPECAERQAADAAAVAKRRIETAARVAKHRRNKREGEQ